MNKRINKNRVSATTVCGCLKGIAHEARLLILMALREGEKGVGALSDALGYAQPTISQHLAKMREKGILKSRRDGTQVFYSVADQRMYQFLDLMKALFCPK